MLSVFRSGAQSVSSSSRSIVGQRWLSSTSIRKVQSENDVTPARAHRKDSSNTAGGQDVDTLSGETKNSRTGSRSTSAEKLANLAAAIPQPLGMPSSSISSSPSYNLPTLNSGILASRTPTPSSSMSSSHVQSPALAPSGYSLTHVPLRSDPILKKLINNIMRDGKKATATRHVLDMLRHMSKAMHADPLPAVKEAVEIASPLVRLQTRKQGGKNTQVPIVLFSNQSRRRGIKAIIEASQKRNDNTLAVRLAKEMIAVLEGNSAAVTRKIDVHKLATVNRSNTGTRV